MALGYNDPLYQQGITQFANETGWYLDMTTTYYGTKPEHWKGDGIITHYVHNRPDLFNWIRKQKVPVTSVNADEAPYWSGTVQDHHKTGELAADHLLECRLTNFAYFRCSDLHANEERQKAFVRKLNTEGFVSHLLDWRPLISKKHTVRYLGQMVKKVGTPLGIFCQSDHRAITLYSACEEVGLNIPSDVAILGVGNNQLLCDFARIPLSSIDVGMHQAGWRCALLLHELMSGGTPPKEPIIIPPVGLIKRLSSNIVQVPHPQVAEAIRYINENFVLPINSNDVIRQLSMTRCGIERAFKKHIGHSIAEEIMRLRIERAKYLLHSTKQKLADIALASGFSSYIHFATAFRRIAGMSISEYVSRQNNLLNL